MALISEKEFSSNFCFTRTSYNDTVSRRWPRRTILLCRCVFLDRVITRSMFGKKWQRFDNNLNGHAEAHMINFLLGEIEQITSGSGGDTSASRNLSKISHDLKDGEPYNPNKRNRLIVISSFSPCKICSDLIIAFATQLENYNIDITIKFANFYKCNQDNTAENCLEGLVNLQKKGIQLEVFKGVKHWLYFLRKIVGISVSEEMEGPLSELQFAPRAVRENIDACILACIKRFADSKCQFNLDLMLKVVTSTSYEEASKAESDVSNYIYSQSIESYH